MIARSLQQIGYGSKFSFACLLMVVFSVPALANDTDRNRLEKGKGYTVGEMPPKEKARFDAYVSKVRDQVRTKLNGVKVHESTAKRNQADVFVIAKLSGSPKTREISASFETIAGVDNGAEQILEFLKATPAQEVRDFRVLSRHSSSQDAESALTSYRGRETELANAIKSDIARKEALRAQRIAQAQARAAYLAQLRNRSRGTSFRRGGSGNC